MRQRLLNRYTVQWFCIVILWFMVAFMFVVPDGYYHGLSVLRMVLGLGQPVARGLNFVPSHISMAVLPGVIRGRVTLCNSTEKTLSNITLTTSCFCTKILGPTSIPTLPPHKEVTIAYQIICPNSGDLQEGLLASVQGAVAKVPIGVHVYSPILEAQPVWRLPTLVRCAPGCATDPVLVPFHPYSSIYSIYISSQIPWLHLSQKLLPGRGHVLVCKADGEAPEGPFSGFVHVQFDALHQTGSTDIPITGQIRSKWQVHPPQYTFGLVAQNSPSPLQTFQIVTDELLPADLTVRCTTPSLEAHLLKHFAHQASFSVRLLTDRPGEIDAYVQLKGGGKTLIAIPISAFVQRSSTRVATIAKEGDNKK
ncbi:hypothetical protein CWRG_01044 [Chthonomonas calidirosea]|uniref:hypothetical protein n=1 Tax=Chthonomonas calidirosea TaxID=454171 RepID=UPI0006DD4171|nr:hypothetical protein [Chthonomonas calidirosea]CEK15094.1 hypothetical protein CWRG_01044 [Chthonomonas calidirosea]